jgi:hypothetical protein
MFHPLYFDMAGRIPVFDLIEPAKNKKTSRRPFLLNPLPKVHDLWRREGVSTCMGACDILIGDTRPGVLRGGLRAREILV